MKKVIENDTFRIEITEVEIDDDGVLDKDKLKEEVFKEKYTKLMPEELESRKDYILNVIVKEINKDKITSTEKIEARIKEICSNMRINLKVFPILLKISAITFVLLFLYMFLFKL